MTAFASSDPIVVASCARTPIGDFNGALSGVSSPELGATAVKAAVERAGISGEQVDRVYMGCVLPAGLGQNPARQAALGAGLPLGAEATTLNKVCGSGMQAAIMGAEALASGSVDFVVAGGMESMTNAPYLLKKHRAGARGGHDTAYDHVFLDGLEDAYDAGTSMGAFAQVSADEYQLTREQMDEFSLESLRRAQEAISTGSFAAEIAPVTVKGRKGDVIVDIDEAPGRAMPDKIPTLKPAFAKDGTITAASSSKISDGAAALVLTRESVAKANGLSPVARIMGLGAHAQKPALFTTAPVPAIQKAMAQAGWQKDDVDLFEINEAFACVTMFAMRDLALDFAKVNVHGGATALGHPIGCSGARILVTLIGALQAKGMSKGVAALCIGGGEGVATALELI
ncbi:MAG: acetyl-CoA C-acyltransferase [Novosphingobium sp.]|nr:acetyl-CoA C-acyltransferase [Novosphingobium sp.]